MAEQNLEQSIFLHAIGLAAPSDRAAYLDETCRDDPGMRAELDALLAAHDRLGGGQPSPKQPEPTAAFTHPTVTMGTVIGPYNLIEPIGEGGMGTVWMAQQNEPVKRLVAVKLIKAGMDTAQVIARFEAERQALALMDHPNIAKVLDGGTTGSAAGFSTVGGSTADGTEADGTEAGGSEAEAERGVTLDAPRCASASVRATSGMPYFVMELVKGQPITKYCDEHRLTPRQRLELFVPVCQAVQHAHQKGIIHRDLKPSNVLVALYDGKPVPKVIDFGVAKATGQSLTDKTLVTGFGNIVGTLEYMSPEQAEVNQLDIDTRSDIYSLGVLLYELLTGSPPFTKKDLEKAGMLEMLRVIREQEPSKPSTKLSTAEGLPTLAANRGTEPGKLTKLVRGELDWIVMKALEKNRSRRYETATGLAADVQRYLHDQPVQACPPSAGYRLRKFMRRNKGAVVAACLTLTALTAGIVATTRQAVQATLAESTAQEQRGFAVAAERERTEQLWKSCLNEAKSGRRTRRPGQRVESLAALARAAEILRSLGKLDEHALELRNEAIACLALTDLRWDKHWAGLVPGEPNAALAFDAKLERYARGDHHGHVSVRRVADDGEIVRFTAFEKRITNLKFSPHGQFLAAATSESQQLQVWDMERCEAIWKEPLRIHRFAVDFRPDDRDLVARLADGSVRCFELPLGRESKRLAMAGQPDTLLFGPDGRKLAMCESASGLVQIRDLDNDAVVQTLRHPRNAANIHGLAWHPTGKLLATGCADHHVYVWDVETGRRRATLEGHQSAPVRLAFHPHECLLASSAWDGTHRLWNPLTGKELVGAPGAGWRALQFSPAGNSLAYGRRNLDLALWEVIPSRECLTLASQTGPGGTWSVSFSPDGGLLAAATNGGVRLWDGKNGEEIDLLPVGTSEGAVFLPDGGLITSSRSGLRRWSVSASNHRRWQLAQAEKLEMPDGLACGRIALSQDGRTLVVLTGTNRGVIWDLEKKTTLVFGESQQPPMVRVAISPDGRWIATGASGARHVSVIDAKTGICAHALDVQWSAGVTFSPDSRWLCTGTGDEYCLWRVGDWERERRIEREQSNDVPAASAFSPDSTVIVVAVAPFLAQLIDRGTGRQLATLESPGTSPVFCFSPDGSRLAVGGGEVVHLWDLRLVRQQLAALGLDWQQPP